ncbi:MAG TPA: hypothetical protein VFI37_06690 [Gaiellaceae bacterium]|nr:hypothetical protein [Gaiellaceae bacterium]
MRRLALLGFVVLALAGCGGAEPLLPRTTAAPLAKQADAIAARLAAGDACGARDHALALQRRTIAAINARRVPAGLQEPLQSRANELVSELEPECLPSVAPESTQPPPQPQSQETGTSPARPGHGEQKKHGPKPRPGKEHRPPHGHGHGHGHGRGGGG